MPTVTLRLRLSIAALTVAAATGGAFLVSSAPAQTQPKPAPVVTPEMLTFHAERMQDLANLKAIGLALVHYEARNPNYRFPDAKHWMDQIAPYLPDRSVLFDPFQPGKHRYGYAFNRNCSKQSLTVFDAPAETVAVYASSLGTRNASDTGQSAFSHSVQRPGMTPWTGSGYGFADGHAKWLRSDVHPSFSLKGGQPNASTTLSDRMLALRQFAAGLAKGQKRGTTLTVDNSPLGQAQFLAGLTPVQGPGVVVTLRDSKKPFPYPKGFPAGMMPPNLIHDTDINQTINELKAAGAEALSVNSQRLVATSAIRHEGQTILINNTPQTPPYVIEAIGDPKALTTMLTMRGGEADQIKQFDPAMFSVKQAAMLTLPAYTGTGEMRYAKPVGIGAQASSNLPKRSFVVNFWVPSTGTHAVQVYVIDATGRHLASAKAYGPGTKFNLPVQAVGRSVSFQIYDNGRLTKTQQIANGSAAPAPSIALRVKDLTQRLATAQEQLAAEQTTHAVINQQLVAVIHAAMPNSPALVQAKALNLEKQIPESASKTAFWKAKKQASQKSGDSRNAARYGHYAAMSSAHVRREAVEEGELFPKTAKTHEALSTIHSLAEKADNERMTLLNAEVSVEDYKDMLRVDRAVKN